MVTITEALKDAEKLFNEEQDSGSLIEFRVIDNTGLTIKQLSGNYGDNSKGFSITFSVLMQNRRDNSFTVREIAYESNSPGSRASRIRIPIMNTGDKSFSSKEFHLAQSELFSRDKNYRDAQTEEAQKNLSDTKFLGRILGTGQEKAAQKSARRKAFTNAVKSAVKSLTWQDPISLKSAYKAFTEGRKLGLSHAAFRIGVIGNTFVPAKSLAVQTSSPVAP